MSPTNDVLDRMRAGDPIDPAALRDSTSPEARAVLERALASPSARPGRRPLMLAVAVAVAGVLAGPFGGGSAITGWAGRAMDRVTGRVPSVVIVTGTPFPLRFPTYLPQGMVLRDAGVVQPPVDAPQPRTFRFVATDPSEKVRVWIFRTFTRRTDKPLPTDPASILATIGTGPNPRVVVRGQDRAIPASAGEHTISFGFTTSDGVVSATLVAPGNQATVDTLARSVAAAIEEHPDGTLTLALRTMRVAFQGFDSTPSPDQRLRYGTDKDALASLDITVSLHSQPDDDYSAVVQRLFYPLNQTDPLRSTVMIGGRPAVLNRSSVGERVDLSWSQGDARITIDLTFSLASDAVSREAVAVARGLRVITTKSFDQHVADIGGGDADFLTGFPQSARGTEQGIAWTLDYVMSYRITPGDTTPNLVSEPFLRLRVNGGHSAKVHGTKTTSNLSRPGPDRAPGIADTVLNARTTDKRILFAVILGIDTVTLEWDAPTEAIHRSPQPDAKTALALRAQAVVDVIPANVTGTVELAGRNRQGAIIWRQTCDIQPSETNPPLTCRNQP